MVKVSQSTKSGFSNKALTGFEKLFLFSVRMNPSNPWKGKLDVARFLPSKSMYRQCVLVCGGGIWVEVMHFWWCTFMSRYLPKIFLFDEHILHSQNYWICTYTWFVFVGDCNLPNCILVTIFRGPFVHGLEKKQTSQLNSFNVLSA